MKEVRRIIVASDAGISIRSFIDISDAIGVCLGAEGLLLNEDDLAPEFFDLRSGLAGELFQKLRTIDCELRLYCRTPMRTASGSANSLMSIDHTL